jgi:hypothetical protein
MTGFRIDGRTIKRGKFVCISHLVSLERSNIAMLPGSSGVVKKVKPFGKCL